MALATVIDPATAVVFMIIPILAVNLSLVCDLTRDELRTCSRRFGPLIGVALVGTVVGMAVLSRIPTGPLRVGLGVLTLGFVATAQRRIPPQCGRQVGSVRSLKRMLGCSVSAASRECCSVGRTSVYSSSRIFGVSTSRTGYLSVSSASCSWDSTGSGSPWRVCSGYIRAELSCSRPSSLPSPPFSGSLWGNVSELWLVSALEDSLC